MSKLLPLTQFPFCRTTDVDQAREAVGRVYTHGTLAPVSSGKSFSYEFNVAPLGRVTLTAMDWGCGMTFDAPSLDECFNFSSIVQGTSELRIGSDVVEADLNRGVVMSPVKSLHIRWSERLVSLDVKVARKTLESHLAAIAGIELKQSLDFSASMRINDDNAAVWRLIRVMADEVDRDESLLAYPLVAERFSETLLTTVLYAQPHNYSEALIQARESAAWSYVRRAEEYMEAHCDEPITAELLADAIGVSIRTLYAGFQKHRDYAPIEFLRSVRLCRARDALLAAPPGGSVSEYALKWGFTHLGRFSALYREQFGESPSETLQRSRS